MAVSENPAAATAATAVTTAGAAYRRPRRPPAPPSPAPPPPPTLQENLGSSLSDRRALAVRAPTPMRQRRSPPLAGLL